MAGRCIFAAWLALTCGIQAGEPANFIDSGRTLIVLAAPAAGDAYYRPLRRAILDFQTAFAKAILGRDNVVILADRATVRELAKELPVDVLLEAPQRDIWTRDFFPVLAGNPVLFRYSAAAQQGNQKDADWVQAGFLRLARRFGLEYRRAPWILDGGNVVDDGTGRVMVTDRFLADNGLDGSPGMNVLREMLGCDRLAILPADPDDRLGHADGLAAFVASNTIAVTRYTGEFRKALKRSLREVFPDARILELESPMDAAAFDPEYGSARGLYVNATVTDRYLYLPVYGLDADGRALKRIRAATDREVIPVDASRIAQLGGSVRCLSAQMKGENARKLMEAARRH